MKKYIIITLLSCSVVSAFAQTTPHSDDILYDIEHQQRYVQNITPMPLLGYPQSNQQEILELSEEQLLANPEFLQQLLDNAIDQQQIAGISVLLPIYLKSTHYDPILYQYGQAIIAEHEGNITQAISLYRKMLAQQADLNPIRLRLLNLLILDKQLISVEHQLIKLRSEQTLPEDVRVYLEQMQIWLTQQNQVNTQIKLRYLDDKNVNQAPKNNEFGVWQLPKPKSAQGIAYQLGVSKKSILTDHLAWQVQGEVDAKQYWNAHQYDDITSHFNIGLTYQTAYQEWGLSPFFEQRWFAQEPYSYYLGIRGQYNQTFSPHWQIFNHIQYGEKKHRERKYLDAQNIQLTSFVRYIHNPTQIFFIGVTNSYEDTKDESEKYQRYGTWLGWENEWKYGLSSHLILGLNNVEYKVEDIFNIKRRDKEHFIQTSIWNRAIHWKGLTPKLTILLRENKSNHFLYDYDKKQFFIELSKTF